jgi:type II secretory pathway pseudopilin PulG
MASQARNSTGKFRQKTRKSSGFSLIELSILVTIVSIIAIGMMEWFTPPIEDEIKKQQVTEERMRNIRHAIQAFYARNERIPCAADITLAETNAAFGVEDCTATFTGVPPAPQAGAIPYRTLGIGIENTVDGWNRRFTYAVSGDDCPRHGTAANRCNDAVNGRQFFRSENRLFTATRKTRLVVVAPRVRDNRFNVTMPNVLYVVVSHGPNGGCAYLPNGNEMPCLPAFEGYANSYRETILNNGSSPVFQDFRTSGTVANQDDILSYRTYEEFITTGRATYFTP